MAFGGYEHQQDELVVRMFEPVVDLFPVSCYSLDFADGFSHIAFSGRIPELKKENHRTTRSYGF